MKGKTYEALQQIGIENAVGGRDLAVNLVGHGRDLLGAASDLGTLNGVCKQTKEDVGTLGGQILQNCS